MPYLENGRHIIDYLMEAGPIAPTGMGNAALSWQELEAWSRASGRHVTSWELRTLRHLSETFLHQHAESSKPNCPSPYTAEMDEDQKIKVAKNIRSILRD